MRACRWLLLAVALACRTASAQFDYALSAFATVGYATSNQAQTYDRYINDRGTFFRDSVAGFQVDAKAFNDFGLTVQVKAAPFTDKDNRYTGSVPWLFASWRPTNDWLVRVGKQRIPYYLYSQSLDIGASYDFARLPIEMYSISAADDSVGVSVDRSWHHDDQEFSFFGFAGALPNNFRYWARDTVPGIQDAGQQYNKLKFRGLGVVLTYKDEERQVRLGAVRGIIRSANGVDFPGQYPFVQIAPGIGYYQVSNQEPGPGVSGIKKVRDNILTAGVDTPLPGGLRFIGEFERSIAQGTPYAPRGNRGYGSLLRKVDKWTPYVSYAFLRSPQWQLDQYTAVNDNMVPFFIPGAAQLNAAQRVAIDQSDVSQQSSWAFGSSYSLTPTSKVKAEFLKTRIGAVSQLVDAAPGATPRHLKIDTFSLSYSVVFQ